MSTRTPNRDAIDLIVSAIVMFGLDGHPPKPCAQEHQMLRHADQLGQLLVNADTHQSTASPMYEWTPVFEFVVSPAMAPGQLVQVEKSRREIEHRLQELPGWTSSPAKRLLQTLGAAIAHSLRDWPMALEAESNRLDYFGMGEARPDWTRADGFDAIATVTAAR